MNVHYLQHVSFEGLGYIETWLKESECTVSSTHFYETDYDLPAVEAIDCLIIMGGPMGIHDDDQYPWLLEEKQFITDCIQSGKKVLGICLGAQLLADNLGAKVYGAPHREIGWFPVKPTEESKQLAWFYDLFKDQRTVFHWHGDQFEIPEGGLDLLSSAANNNQAFSYGDNLIGLQFHLEVTRDTLNDMLENGASELTDAPYIQKVAEITAREANIARCNAMMASILGAWLSR
ncbi:type 1 glutamine amidotransferase [Sphingobacterium pedocola]|uniref:Amidotransferase n=1 Tax=Sphingobacterium pedocola TaxID=2082722 RepID=A0ABR9T494_9SPHI|nr:type 1 glutamine amidotransferase [Sphingobacterium pedocola]MBE8720161.1 amidotransferase [Sphingobacterium pedocola]